MPRRTKLPNTAIIGAGRVGSALAMAFRRNRTPIVAVISRAGRSARRLAQSVGCSTSGASISLIPSSTRRIVIAVSDDAIGAVASELSSHPSLDFRRLVVFHVSGALTSDLLVPMAQLGATTFSLHPIQTFPRTKRSTRLLDHLRDIYYGYEGQPMHAAAARQVVRELKGRFISVPKEQKILYHIACVFASNYTTVLLGAAETVARDSGLASMSALRNLVETSVGNALDRGPIEALTGPLARGDEETVRAHLRELSQKRPDLVGLYSALASFGLVLAREQGFLRENDLRTLKDAIEGKS